MAQPLSTPGPACYIDDIKLEKITPSDRRPISLIFLPLIFLPQLPIPFFCQSSFCHSSGPFHLSAKCFRSRRELTDPFPLACPEGIYSCEREYPGPSEAVQ